MLFIIVFFENCLNRWFRDEVNKTSLRSNSEDTKLFKHLLSVITITVHLFLKKQFIVIFIVWSNLYVNNNDYNPYCLFTKDQQRNLYFSLLRDYFVS